MCTSMGIGIDILRVHMPVVTGKLLCMETGLHLIYRDPSSMFPRGQPEGTFSGVGAGAALVERLPLRPSPHSFISPVMYPRALWTLFPMVARELRIQEVLEMPVSTFISELSSMVSRACPGTRDGQEAPHSELLTLRSDVLARRQAKIFI